jgi:hypothetical protein
MSPEAIMAGTDMEEVMAGKNTNNLITTRQMPVSRAADTRWPFFVLPVE